MSFTARTISLAPDISFDQGVLWHDEWSLWVDAQRAAGRLIDAADDQSRALLREANAQARRLREEAQAQWQERIDTSRQQAETLLADIQRQWDEMQRHIDACAIAVARTALQRLGVDLSQEDRLRAAVSMAMEQLPAAPLRVMWPATSAEAPGTLDGVPVERAAELASATVALEADLATVVCDHEAAWAGVQNTLRDWLREQLDT
ncbi:hypothetical protein AACH06_03900 [Ideonella sp. DXS29W]|uniref:HrpE/YscL family type III secretion apparatus protein n=1 Tax=Ideonella lacteola TaxID=2984193 RepID=A0ABU9BJN9_9BURK